MVLPHERDSIALAVALANTWDVLNDPPEHLDDVEMLRLILRAFGLNDEAERARERRPGAASRDARPPSDGVFGAADEAAAVRRAERPGARGRRNSAARRRKRRLELSLRRGTSAARGRPRRTRERRAPRRHRGGRLEPLRPLRRLALLLRVRRPLAEPEPALLLPLLRRPGHPGGRPQAPPGPGRPRSARRGSAPARRRRLSPLPRARRASGSSSGGSPSLRARARAMSQSASHGFRGRSGPWRYVPTAPATRQPSNPSLPLFPKPETTRPRALAPSSR